MSEVSDRYGVVAGGFTERVRQVPADRWPDATPCTEWAARDIVSHVISVHRRVLAALEGDEAAPVEVQSDSDLLPQWLAAKDSVAAALEDEARASKVVSGVFSEQPWESLVGRLLCADTLIHTWDLARATGLDERLDAAAVVKSLEFLLPMDEGLRRPGGFAAKIEPGPGADEQTRLLNFTGRAV